MKADKRVGERRVDKKRVDERRGAKTIEILAKYDRRESGQRKRQQRNPENDRRKNSQ